MRALALFMVVAATLPLTFVRPIVGLIVWIGFSYMNPHRIAWGFATNFPWVMISAVLTLTCLTLHPKQRQSIPMTPVIVLMTLFLFWTGITSLTAAEGDNAIDKWIEFFKILLMVYATLILVIDKQRLHWVLWAIVLSFGFWGFKGGLFTIVSGGGYHVFGPSDSFFHNNNDFALVMAMTIPLMRYFQLYESRKWIRYGLGVLIGLSVISIVGTYSRGGFLALAAVAFVLVLKSRRRAALFILGPVFIMAVAAFIPQKYYNRIQSIENYRENASAMGRIESWRFATNVALANPVVGGGFRVWANDSMWNTYGPPGAVHRAIHSIFFQVLGGHSFVGLGLFVGLIIAGWSSLGRIQKKARAGPEELTWIGDLASMLQVSLTGYVVAGAFLTRAYFDLFYQLLALTAILHIFIDRSDVSPQVRSDNATARDDTDYGSPSAPASGRGYDKPPRGGNEALPPW